MMENGQREQPPCPMTNDLNMLERRNSTGLGSGGHDAGVLSKPGAGGTPPEVTTTSGTSAPGKSSSTVR